MCSKQLLKRPVAASETCCVYKTHHMPQINFNICVSLYVCATLNVFAYAYTICFGTWICLCVLLWVHSCESACICSWQSPSSMGLCVLCVTASGNAWVDVCQWTPLGFKRSPSFPCSPSLVEAGWGKLSHEASARAKGSPQQIKMQFSAPPCTEARDSLHVMDSPRFLYSTGPLCYSSLTVSSAFMLPIFLCSILTSQLMGPIQ